jgi:hypothetical protein
MGRASIAFGVAASISCGSSQLPPMHMRAPNPNGCYVMLFEQPSFAGSEDVLNGPRRWPDLRAVQDTNYPDWTNRIRSLKTGPAATVTAFTEARFGGLSERYPAGTDHAALRPEFSEKIASIDVACVPNPAR